MENSQARSNLPMQEDLKNDQVAALYGKRKLWDIMRNNSAIALVKKAGKKKAEKFIKEDHSDTNMLVSIRIRPLNQKEIQVNDIDIIRSEDKLLVIFFHSITTFRSFLTKLS